MAEFLWTLAVAVVGVMAGYILCASLVRDKITNTERIAAKHYRATQRAEAAVERVREQLHKPWKYECECCTRIWIALEGDGDEPAGP